MKKYSIPTILCLCVIVSFPATADEGAGQSSPSVVHVDSAQERLALSVAGEEKEGMLEFFVDKDTSSPYVTQDVTAGDLNAISPAAGVQFRLEF